MYAMLMIGFLPLELSIGFSLNSFCLFKLTILDYNGPCPSLVTIFGIETLVFWFDLAHLYDPVD